MNSITITIRKRRIIKRTIFYHFRISDKDGLKLSVSYNKKPTGEDIWLKRQSLDQIPFLLLQPLTRVVSGVGKWDFPTPEDLKK